jgi:hypothetical protein
LSSFFSFSFSSYFSSSFFSFFFFFFFYPVPIEQEAGWAPGPVWTGAENLAPHRDSIPGPSSP